MSGSSNSKNAFFNVVGVVGSNLGDGALRFFISILIARFFLVEEYGFLNFVFAWVAYLLLLSDFGLQQILVREIAHKRDEASTLFFNASLVRLVVSVAISVLVGAGIGLFSGYEGWKIAIASLALSTLFLNAVNPGSLFDSFNLSRYDALLHLSATALYAVAAACALMLFGVRYLPLIVLLSVLSQLVYTILGNWLFQKRISSFHPSVSIAVVKRLVGEGKTIVWARLMAQVYTNMDLIMIGILLGDRAVGYYAIAYKLLFAAIALNSAIHRVFLPLISEVRDDLERLKMRLEHFGKLLSFTSLPIAIFGIAFADKIVLLFYTDKYAPSIPVLRILFLYVAIVGIGSIFGTTLFSLGKNREYTTGITLGAISNIALNLILISICGIIGAGIATIVSQLIVVAYTFFRFRRLIRIAIVRNIAIFGGLSLLTVSMGLFLSDVAGLNFLIAIAIGGVTYIVISVVSGMISRKELAKVGINWLNK